MSDAVDPKSSEPASSDCSDCCAKSMRDLCDSVETCARNQPLQCTLLAFAAGLVLTVLPVGLILNLVIRLVLALIRPALIVLGALKVIETLEKRR